MEWLAKRLLNLQLKLRNYSIIQIKKYLWMIAIGPSLKPMPKITLVTPVLNSSKYIAETLYSVLTQEYPALEYIIVDGGSTDGTLDIIKDFQSRLDLKQKIKLVLSEPDLGMYDAIAKGFENATGEIFCYINADDLLESNGLSSVGEYFANNTSAQVIYHEDVVLIDGWKYPNTRQPKSVGTADLLAGHILFQDGVFWRRKIYESVGGIRRDFKLAGDFDLWLRMSAHCRFIRRPGHVSCFRIRPGQLSAQMDAYRLEMKESVQDFMGAMSFTPRIVLNFKKILQQVLTKLLPGINRDRLFFPIDFTNMPPPEVFVPSIEKPPLSPVDGKAAERLLFSSPDTRFGEKEINYVYLDSRHNIAITHPPILSEKLDDLYRQHYSNPTSKISLPKGSSPYRKFNGMRFWQKILFCLPVGRFFHLIPNVWSDNTLEELLKVLNASKIDVNKSLSFLDTGCFEGGLLDQIRDRTNWTAFGLEPNDHAVNVARSKGHLVWHGHAEDAVEFLPDNREFDVIFMGQSIEHVEDPVRVLRRLKMLLAPGGLLVVSTPNLDSIDIDQFGPTWAHWHVPFHRYIFSPKGMRSIAKQVGLKSIYFKSFSNAYWSTMSIVLNKIGLAGNVSHTQNFTKEESLLGFKIFLIKKIFFNYFGKGDYFYMAMNNDE